MRRLLNWRRGFEVEARVCQACPLERIREVTSHPGLPNKLGIEVELKAVADVLEHVVFYSLVEVFLVGNETRAV